jgi:hypothetical protein
MAAMWEMHDGTAQIGPLDEDHVLRMIAHGIPAATVCRPVGASQWKSLRVHAPFAVAIELAAAKNEAPPPPAASAAPTPPPGYPPLLPPGPPPAWTPPTPPPPVFYVQAPPPAQPSGIARAGASGVRIVGGLIFFGGLICTIPGCLMGGPVGIIVALVVAFFGYFLTRVEA